MELNEPKQKCVKAEAERFVLSRTSGGHHTYSGFMHEKKGSKSLNLREIKWG